MKATKVFAVVALLLMVSIASGCIGKRPEAGAPSTPSAEVPAEDLESQFPNVSAETGDDLGIVEPDLEAEETVDLGSIL